MKSLELRRGGGPGAEQLLRRQPGVLLPLVGIGAVEEHDRPGRRLGAERRAAAIDPLQLELGPGVGLAVDLPAVDGRLVNLVDDDLVALALGVGGDHAVGAGGLLDDRLAVPAVAGQSAGEEHRAELAVAQRPDLRTEPGLAAVGLRDLADVFPLELEVGVRRARGRCRPSRRPSSPPPPRPTRRRNGRRTTKQRRFPSRGSTSSSCIGSWNPTFPAFRPTDSPTATVEETKLAKHAPRRWAGPPLQRPAATNVTFAKPGQKTTRETCAASGWDGRRRASRPWPRRGSLTNPTEIGPSPNASAPDCLEATPDT